MILYAFAKYITNKVVFASTEFTKKKHNCQRIKAMASFKFRTSKCKYLNSKWKILCSIFENTKLCIIILTKENISLQKERQHFMLPTESKLSF